MSEVKILETKVGTLETITTLLAQNEQNLGAIQANTNQILYVLSEQIKQANQNMTTAINEQMATAKEEIKRDTATTSKAYVDAIIQDKLDERGLSKYDADRLTKMRNKRFIELLGDPKSDLYILFIGYFQNNYRKKYQKRFKVSRYGDISAAQFQDVESFTKTFNVPDVGYIYDNLHRRYRDGELPIKMKNAYERYFGVNTEMRAKA